MPTNKNVLEGLAIFVIALSIGLVYGSSYGLNLPLRDAGLKSDAALLQSELVQTCSPPNNHPPGMQPCCPAGGWTVTQNGHDVGYVCNGTNLVIWGRDGEITK